MRKQSALSSPKTKSKPSVSGFDFERRSSGMSEHLALAGCERYGACSDAVGVDYREGPPVPIPNTEVKLVCADNSMRVTACEDR